MNLLPNLRASVACSAVAIIFPAPAQDTSVAIVIATGRAATIIAVTASAIHYPVESRAAFAGVHARF